ncbi:PIN domain-like protein [Paraphoma chrysanthemicola]|uniref:PIN domain-like protein n=1 Tax=Paraphoma chrysanthemicola TaxID=798071 RepID=A0A8K0VY27_9PLEO|nr:PIN domain-like protein [Paraphoma chrysanthemicola]
MGIPDLRPTIEACEEIIPIGQLAEQHFRYTGRPLRIAVDESDWRFNNVSPEKVAAIRKKVPAANPVEKAMFYRICNLLTLNTELVFVFDGPDVPPKRGRSHHGRLVNHKDRQLLKETLECFGIPWVDAPGEAEAECCHMQRLGLVDAVWSQDSDCLMFGCDLWLRDHRTPKDAGYDNRNKAHTKKAATSVRVVRTENLKQKHRLRREGCVLFALLAGGDYDGTGLVRCGAATALKVAQAGLGISLCNSTSQNDCNAWAKKLAIFFKKENIPIAIPANFPNFQILQKYNNPKVLSESTLRRNPKLELGYKRKVDEVALLLVTSHRYNTWGKDYMEWVAPTLLTQALANEESPLSAETIHSIQLTNKKTRITDGNSAQLEQKISFSPFGLTMLRKHVFEGPMSGYWTNPSTRLFDIELKVECYIPVYLLAKVLPPAAFDSTFSSRQVRPLKRKFHDDADAHNSLANNKPPVARLPSASATQRCLGSHSDRFGLLQSHVEQQLRLPGADLRQSNAVISQRPNTRPSNSIHNHEQIETETSSCLTSIRPDVSESTSEYLDHDLRWAMQVSMVEQRRISRPVASTAQVQRSVEVIDLTNV